MTQALLQIPLGLASDRLGRKRVIIAGLLVFAAGSFIAASAHSLGWLIVGRARQGAGAVCAAVTALLADQTRDEVRAKALAPMGAGPVCDVCRGHAAVAAGGLADAGAGNGPAKCGSWPCAQPCN